jgi:hypothetical protein
VASVLYDNEIHPEHAADVIERSGGIEKIARTGKLYEPVYCETADCGDGYDNWGRKLYPDEDGPTDPTAEDDDGTEYEPIARLENGKSLLEYAEQVPVGEGQVNIAAKYIKTPHGTLFEILEVQGGEADGDAFGNRIGCPEEIKPKTDKPEVTEEAAHMRSEQRMFDYVGAAEEDEGTVNVVMSYRKTEQGLVTEILKVETAEPGRVIFPLDATLIACERMKRMKVGRHGAARFKKCRAKDGSIHYLTTVVRAPVTKR